MVVLGNLREGVGGHLSIFGTMRLAPGAALDDKSVVTVGQGGALGLLGSMLVEAGAALTVDGILAGQKGGSLDIFGNVSMEAGSTYSLAGQVSVEPGGSLTVLVPFITLSTPTLDLGTTRQGMPGGVQSWTVSGKNLTADLLLSAPSGVELSDNGGSSYSPTIDLPEVGGMVGPTTILVRIAESAAAGSFSTTIAAHSTGANEQDVQVRGTVQATPQVTVNPVNITFGTPLQNSQLSGTASLMVNGQVVNVAGSFSYTSAIGTVLMVGNNQTEDVTFTPNDTIDYTAAQATASINVGATSTITWINTAGGDWDTPSNWDLGRVPGLGDDVVITIPGITITHASAQADAIQSLTSQAFISLSAGSLTIGGASAINATLTIAGATVSITDRVTVQNLELDSGTLTGAGAVTITESFTWTGGTMSGPVSTNLAAGSTFTISGAADKVLDGWTLNLAGTTTWSDGGNLMLADNAVINNQSGALFSILNDQGIQGNGLFNNAGTLVKTTGTGTTTFAAGIAISNNGGMVDVESGTLSVAGDYTQNSGGTVLAAGATLAAGGTVNILAGMLSGSGTVSGDVVNSGHIDPLGILTIQGNCTQTAQGTLNIEIGGTTAGTDYGKLVVTGLATLDGTLNVELTNGYMPNVGDSFQVLIFGSRSGDFATENGLNIGGGLRLDPQYDASSLTFVAGG
jgi:hypothetical protein